MQYNLFGNTGMQVSRFCLGAMTFINKLEADESLRVIDEALDQGVNFIDTADSYRDSEERLGEQLKDGRRGRVFLASKVYRQFIRDQKIGRNSRTNILHNVERSLTKLQTDHLDLYQLHHPDPQTPVEETLQTMDTLVQQGKVRYWGVSNHYAWQMSYMLGLTHARHLESMVSVQSNYSMMERQIEREVVPMLGRFNIALMCYSPLCRGILTGRYHPESGEPDTTGSAMQGKMFKKRIDDPEVSRIVHEFRDIAKQQSLGMNQLAVIWLLSKPYVSTVILGGSKAEQFSSLYDVADHELSDEVIQRIDELSAARIDAEYLNQPFIEGPRLNPNA